MLDETGDEINKLKCGWGLTKRRLDPSSVLFEEGDTYCRCLQKCFPAEEKDTELLSSSKEFACGISNCHQVFDSLIKYEAHYNSSHRHVCHTCQRIYPTSHLLEVHILETHDVMFALLAQKQCMFQCLLADCTEKFKTWKDRRNHMIKVHKFPPNYRYDRAKNTSHSKSAKPKVVKVEKGQEENANKAKIDTGENKNMEEAMEADSTETTPYVNTETCDTTPAVNKEPVYTATERPHRNIMFSHRVPKEISFGHGVPRGFMGSRGRGRGRGKQKKKHWHNTSDSDTTVDIESVSMKDLSDALS